MRTTMQTRLLLPTACILAAGWFLFPIPHAAAQSTPSAAAVNGVCEPYWTEAYKRMAAGCQSASSFGSGALTRQQMQLQFGQRVMQGAIQGFMGAMQRSAANAAAARQQQQAFQAEMLRRQQQAELQRQLAEQQRIAAMFARLDSELKLSNLPFQVAMKDTDLPGPGSMGMKGMDDSDPDQVKMKFGQDTSPTTSNGITGPGIPGLPGIYVGGPGSGTAANPSSSTPSASSPTESGTTGPGIPGLPGIYLDGAQPNQAPQIAQMAQNLPAGPERDITADTALQAALHNPALTAPTQDPQVADFQQQHLTYQQALQTAQSSSQQLAAAQSQVTSDQSAIATVKAQLAGLQPTQEQQAALSQMLFAAKTDEAAAEDARKIFDNANANLSVARSQALHSLAQLPRDPNAAPIHLSRNPAPMLLRPPGAPGAIAYAPGHPLPAIPAAPVNTAAANHPPAPTRVQFCTTLAGAQSALHRLQIAEMENSQNFDQWGSIVDKASDDAWQRGLDMLRSYLGERVNAHIEGRITSTEDEIQSLYRRVSNEKRAYNMVDTQKELEALQDRKTYLLQALERARKDEKQLDLLAEERDFLQWNKENEGDKNGNLEGVRMIVDNLIGDKQMQQRLGISEAADAIQYGESIVDSSYDILGEVYGAQRIKQYQANQQQFQQAQSLLQHRIRSTVAQLNLLRHTAPAGQTSCSALTAH